MQIEEFKNDLSFSKYRLKFLGQNKRTIADIKKYAKTGESMLILCDDELNLTNYKQILCENHYDILEFNFLNPNSPLSYNPLQYLYNEEKVRMFLNDVSRNSTTINENEINLLSAIIFYLKKYRPSFECTFSSVMKLLRAGVPENINTNEKTALDLIFNEVHKRDHHSIAFRQYMSFYSMPPLGKLITVSNLLNYFSVFNYDDINDKSTISKVNIEKYIYGIENSLEEKIAIIVIRGVDSYELLYNMFINELENALNYNTYNCNNKIYDYQYDNVMSLTLKDKVELIKSNPSFTKPINSNDTIAAEKWQLNVKIKRHQERKERSRQRRKEEGN